MTASVTFKNKLRTIDSTNVVARLEGADPDPQGRIRHLHGPLGPFRDRARGQRRQDLQRGASTTRPAAPASSNWPAPSPGSPRPQALDPLPLRHRRGAGPPRIDLLRPQPDLPARPHGRRRQHRRPERPRPDERPRGRRPRELRARRLPAGRGRRAGPHPQARPDARKGIVLPLRPLPLRQAGRAGDQPGRRDRVHRPPRRLGPQDHGGLHARTITTSPPTRSARIGT